MRKQLLIVDDDPLFVDFVKEVLTVEEIDVISAPNGRAALSLVDVTPPSFILSDFEMPEMNGLELHAHLCEDEKTRHIPFYFMTGSSDQTLVRYAREHSIRLFYKGNLVSELLRLLDSLK